MSAYIISNVEVFRNEPYAEYGKLAYEAVTEYGGEFLARGGSAEVLEGSWQAHRVVVIRFDSMEQAKKMYNSVEYQAAKARREGASDFNMMVVEGV